MQGVAVSLILLDLMKWLNGNEASSSIWWGAGLLVVGSLLAPKKKFIEVPDPGPIDISEINFKVLYKEHDGKLWRYISLPDSNARAEAQEMGRTHWKGGFTQAVVKKGTPEWIEYHKQQRILCSKQEERKRLREKKRP